MRCCGKAVRRATRLIIQPFAKTKTPMIVLPVVAGIGAIGAAYLKVRSRKSKLTPQRKKIYTEALKSLKDPVKLRKLADTFEKEGLKHEASMLRKRADLRAKPQAQKEAHVEAFKKGMQSKDPKAVHKLADAFTKQGALSTASKLKKYAMGLINPSDSA